MSVIDHDANIGIRALIQMSPAREAERDIQWPSFVYADEMKCNASNRS
jgi:hypothetical protein